MATPVSIANNSDIHIRLLQFKPAWALHCLLRFKNLPYLCENTCSQNSLGLRVPLLVDGNFVFAERLAIEHLNMDRRTRNDECEYPIPNISPFDSQVEVDQFMMNDRIMSNHIEVALLLVYSQLESLMEVQSKKKVHGLSVPSRIIGKMRMFSKSFDVSSSDATDEHSYLECNMDTLLTRLDTIYSEFNTILEKNRGFLISISVTAPTLVTPSSNLILGGQKNITRNRGISEAILFGHLAESMSNQFSSILLLKYPALLCLVRNILEEYFLTPLRSPQNTLKTCLWEDATSCIRENKFFLQLSDSTLKDSLLAPLCPPSPNGFQGVNPIRVTITERNNSVNSERNNSINSGVNSTYNNNHTTTATTGISNNTGIASLNISGSSSSSSSISGATSGGSGKIKLNVSNLSSNSILGGESYLSPRRSSTSTHTHTATATSTHSARTATATPSSPGLNNSSPRTVMSPRNQTSPRSSHITRTTGHTVGHSIFDFVGTDLSQEEIMRFRDVGPRSILDVRTEYCGRYLCVPSYFKYFFPLLNEQYGDIRLSKISKIFSSENQTDIIDDIPLSESQKNVEIKPIIEVLNREIEISCLGVIFMSAVSGVFLLNIITGSS